MPSMRVISPITLHSLFKNGCIASIWSFQAGQIGALDLMASSLLPRPQALAILTQLCHQMVCGIVSAYSLHMY